MSMAQCNHNWRVLWNRPCCIGRHYCFLTRVKCSRTSTSPLIWGGLQNYRKAKFQIDLPNWVPDLTRIFQWDCIIIFITLNAGPVKRLQQWDSANIYTKYQWRPGFEPGVTTSWGWHSNMSTNRTRQTLWRDDDDDDVSHWTMWDYVKKCNGNSCIEDIFLEIEQH